jgi:uncharacterized protein (TIGR03086 family)
MTTLLERYQRISEGFERRLEQVGPDAWHSATPCADWDVTQLAAHVLDEQLWIPPLLDGETIAEVGDRFAGDQLGADPIASWRSAATRAGDAMAAEGSAERVVHLSYGDEAAESYLWQVTSDTLIHTWDLARAIGADEDLGAADVEAVSAFLGPLAEAWRSAGAFGEAVPVDDGADAQTRLLALTGRRA